MCIYITLYVILCRELLLPARHHMDVSVVLSQFQHESVSPVKA